MTAWFPKSRRLEVKEKLLEIDETKVGRRKYNRGRRVAGQSGNIFLNPMATLLPLIKEWILPETTIMSDCWKPYDILGEEGYHHLRVNHSITFKVPPETGHVQIK